MIHVKPDQHEAAIDDLVLAERFLLWNLRAWACSCRRQSLPAEPVRQAFANIGLPTAAAMLDSAMTHLVLSTSRPLAVHCPPHRGLSDDETMLVAAASAAQRRDSLAVRALLAEVLSGPGLDLVVQALGELGLLLSTVGILLPRGGPSGPTDVEHAVVPPTLH